MALEVDFIKNNIAGLTEDQYAKIAELSKEDERVVRERTTSEVTGSLYQNIDNDLKEMGFEKPSTEKTYKYLKQVVGELKAAKTDLEGKYNALKDKPADEQTKKLLEDERSKTNTLMQQLETERKASQQMKDDYEKRFFSHKVESVLNGAMAGLDFRKDVPESIRDLALKEAKAQLMAGNIEFIDDSTMVFKDGNGFVINNPGNGGKPMTAEEMLKDNPLIKDMLATTRKTPGGGSKNPPVLQGDMSIGNARTQEEVEDIISKDLASKGFVRGTLEFKDEMDKIWSENQSVISKLPMK